MRALLLSAGLGTRLRPITDQLPKCLVPVSGRPLMEYWLRLLVHGGIRNILVNTHYRAAQVNDFIAGSEYVPYVTLVHEEILLGTGGTLLRNREFFGADPVMLIHGDNLSLFNVRDFVRAFEERPKGAEITMMTFDTDAPQNCGIVELDSFGIVRGFYEKVQNPPGRLANGAVYMLSGNVVGYLASLGKEFIDFSTEVIPHFIGRMNTFHNKIYHRDIGTPESLSAAQSELPLALSRFSLN
ncbi:MAG: nucleotidyltransferase family protein [Pseudomonadota bacterium]